MSRRQSSLVALACALATIAGATLAGVEAEASPAAMAPSHRHSATNRSLALSRSYRERHSDTELGLALQVTSPALAHELSALSVACGQQSLIAARLGNHYAATILDDSRHDSESNHRTARRVSADRQHGNVATELPVRALVGGQHQSEPPTQLVRLIERIERSQRVVGEGERVMCGIGEKEVRRGQFVLQNLVASRGAHVTLSGLEDDDEVARQRSMWLPAAEHWQRIAGDNFLAVHASRVRGATFTQLREVQTRLRLSGSAVQLEQRYYINGQLGGWVRWTFG